MNSQEYSELMIDMLKLDPDWAPIQIPAVQLPGESEEDTTTRWLFEQGMVIVNDDDRVMIADREKIISFDPNLYKILCIMMQAQLYEDLDRLEEKGFIYTSVNENGDIIKVIEQTGEEIIIEDENY